MGIEFLAGIAIGIYLSAGIVMIALEYSDATEGLPWWHKTFVFIAMLITGGALAAAKARRMRG